MNNNNTTRKWITGSLILIGLLVVAPWLIGWRMESVTRQITQEMATPLAKVSFDKELKLNADQIAKITDLESSYTEWMSQCCARHCTARMKIGKLLEENPGDLSSLNELGKEVGEAYANAEKATMEHVIRVCEILTPEQKAIFLKKIGRNIAATCPAPFVTK
jgi:Spy/CpxP family protein refolding chaperone